MASYYFQRGEEKVGPFSLEEMTEFLEDGRVGYTDRVMREGDAQWWPVHSIPELEAKAKASLVAQGVASDPRTQAPAVASRPMPARGSTPGRPRRPGTWAAGGPPRRPGVFVRYDNPLSEVPALLEDAGSRFATLEARRSRARVTLVPMLLALALLATWIDRWTGFGASTFSFLVPFSLAGAALVLLATRRGGVPVPGAVWERVRRFGFYAIVATFLGWGFGSFVIGALLLLPQVAVPAAVLVALAVWLVRSRRKAAPASGPGGHSWSARLSAVARTLETLRDDAAPGRPAVGWLDLTGSEQAHKLLATGKSTSGAPAEVYRDDWWSLLVPLRDGNRLRVLASDRVKVKRGHWRRGSRKSKWKPGAERRLSSVGVRLRVNPGAYRIVTEAEMPYVTVAGNTLSTAFDARDGLEIKDLVRSLSLLYKRLEPLTAKAPGG
jgi:hypothetical protein